MPSIVVNEFTEIEYDFEFPQDQNILGYWILFNEDLEIEANYVDDALSLSDKISLQTQHMKSENQILLSDIKIADQPTSFADNSYLTVTEFFKNPFGICSYSYLCIHSDCISKKCIHPNTSYRSNYIYDPSISGCKHIPQNEENPLLEMIKCPGMEVQLVNPFIMPVIQKTEV